MMPSSKETISFKESIERLKKKKRREDTENQPDNIEINRTHLIGLFKDGDDDKVKIDYLEIANPLRAEIDEIYRLCDSEEIIDNVNEILDLHPEIIEVLKEKDFCWHIDKPYQSIEGVENLRYVYDEKLTEEEKDKEIIEDKKHLKKIIHERDLPYAIEFSYDEANGSDSCRAYSHRKRGWAHPIFSITKDIKVKIDTNFGYGNSSYFYLTLYFKDIAIAPYSNWVVYSNGSLYEIIRHTSGHRLEDESWFDVMTYVRDAVNLYKDDEQAFIETYILGECELLVDGLGKILENKTNIPYFAQFHSCQKDKYRIENSLILNQYRGEKITGAIDFIEGIASCSSFVDTQVYINKIQAFNIKLKPELEFKIQRLEKELPEATRLLNEAESAYLESENQLKPTMKILMRINSIGRYLQRKNSGNNKKLLELFHTKYPEHSKLAEQHNENVVDRNKKARYKKELVNFINQFNGYKDKIDKVMPKERKKHSEPAA